MYIFNDPTFPIYQIVYDIFDTKLYKHELRFVFNSSGEEFKTQQHILSPNMIPLLSKTDIVFVSLYTGYPSFPGPGTSSKLPQYQDNIDIIKDIAPKVEGIMVGNALAELTFRNKYTDPLDDIKACCDFVEETSEIIESAGGKPVYAPINLDIVYDCYYADWKLRETLNKHKSLSVCFCGSWIHLGALTDHGAEVRPWNQFRDYLDGTNMYCDVDYQDANIGFLKYMNFKGAI